MVGSLRPVIRGFDRHCFIRREKNVFVWWLVDISLIGRARILHGLYTIPDHESSFVHTIGIDRRRDDVADDHRTIIPFLCPDELALEMSMTLQNSGRLDSTGRQRR